MDALQFFLREHALVHLPEVADGEGGMSLEVFAVRGLSDEQLRIRPHGFNSIAWLLWHITRIEDVTVNVVLAGRPQVLFEGGFYPRLNVAERDVGTGMTADEVGEFSDAVDLSGLRQYRTAAGRRTREIVAGLAPEVLDGVVDPVRVDQAASLGAFRPNATRLVDLWKGKSRAWLLYWPVVGHSHFHLGHARWVRKLVHRSER